ncbi:hypothetical protein JCM21900_005196 [Sporobolomyces salmonicolor]
MAVPPAVARSVPADPTAPLASLSLLPYLSLSPAPTVILRVPPLLDALRSRRALSPLRTPLWSGVAYHPPAVSLAQDPFGEHADPDSESGQSALAGMVDNLHVKTPNGAAEASDYFSLGRAGVATGVEAASAPTSKPARRPVGTAGRTEGNLLHMGALEPAWKNKAWREGLQATGSADQGWSQPSTRRSSATTTISTSGSGITSPVGTGTSGGNTTSGVGTSARGIRAKFARMLGGGVGGGEEKDVVMSERGLGTVVEDLDEADGDDVDDVTDDDFEPEKGIETWQATYSFLSSTDQQALLDFLLDLLDNSEVAPPANSTPAVSAAPFSAPSTDPPPINPSVIRGDNVVDPSSSSASSSVRLACGFTFTALLIPPPASTPLQQSYSPANYHIVLSTPSAFASDPSFHGYRVHRNSSIGSTFSVTTPGPSLAQKQQEQPAASLSSIHALSMGPSLQGTVSGQPLSPRRGEAAPGTSEDPWVKRLGSSDMARRIREHAWHKTAVGPIESWPSSLKTMVTSILASPFRECILWGPSKIIIYNDLYIHTAGGKHPELLGLPAQIGWSEIWDGLERVANRALSGETVFFRDHFLAMERGGYLEETYHTFSYAPFYDGDGEVMGIINLSIETTATVIAARRLATVRDLVQMTNLARTVDDFCTTAIKSLSSNPYDLPFVLLYRAEEIAHKPTSKEVRAGLEKSVRTSVKLTCKGSLGVPHDHPFLVSEATVDTTPPMSRQSSSSASTASGSTATAMDLRERLLEYNSGSPSPAASPGAHQPPLPLASSSGSTSTASARQLSSQSSKAPAWSWPFEEACHKREPVFIEDLGAFTNSLEKRGWGNPPKHAVVIPIMVEAGQTIPGAFFVLGVNSMNQYDHLMETFFNLVARHVAIGLFAVLAAEQDRQRAEELIKLDRSKSNFFSSVSHELRTPLTLILGPLEDILSPGQREQLGPEQRDKLVLVSKHANRLLNMVNKLLDFSSIEGGRMNFKFRPVQIGPLTRDIALLFRDAVERAKIRFYVETEDDPSDAWPIYLSPDLWEKVIMNLCGNALKYCRSGEIKVTLKSTRGEAVLSVSDTGVGIPQDELGKIFDRFHRIERDSRMATGTGIGLALTLELVKLIGGQLEVESELGKGSTFTVRLQRGYSHLPIEQVDHTPEDPAVLAVSQQGRNLTMVEEAAAFRYDTVDESPLSSASSSASTSAMSEHGTSSGSGSGEDYLGSADVLSLKNRTIVLVDDSRDLRTYIGTLLSKQFNVVQFGDPREALEYINNTPPSLILTDSMMPYLSGQELTAAVRQNPHTALIPIVMVSAQAGTEARADALEGGVDDYLVKPFQARELLARVRVHLQLGLMRVELEKRVEERTRALIESEARNRALAERYSTLSTVSPVGVVQINSHGHIVYANPRWYEITGHPYNKPLSDWVDDLVEDDVPRMNRIWQASIFEGKQMDAGDRQFRYKCGTWGQLEIRASNDVGLPDGYVGALTDITRQKEMEELHIRTIEQRAADAEENRRNTEMFLDMSSHEMRNPLSGVWQNAEVLSASLEKYVELINDLRERKVVPLAMLDELHAEMLENVEAVESIMLCASHQGRIADDILNVSKLNMGLLTINPVPFELIPRMSEVKKVCEAECSQKQINLELKPGQSVERFRATWVKADPSRLHQILLNFLSNSIKYTTDSPNPRIVIHIEAYEQPPPERPQALRVSQSKVPVELEDLVWVVVSVEDSGRGLSQEELKRLFARFSQANPRSDQYGGSGLGLYVSKKLVELHSGFIEVESKLGVGSIFSFAIPAQRTSPPEDPVPVHRVPAMSMIPTTRSSKRPLTASAADSVRSTKSTKVGAGPSSPLVEAEGRKTKILVVEDNLINQKVMMRQLKLAGYEVMVANNGLEALDILMKDVQPSNTEQINLCLMDIEMPIMDGLACIRELRRREQTGEISRRYPCVSITGNAREGQKRECLQAGFNDVLSKPYKFTDVVDRIERLKLVP